jgi:hypothetical protein
MGVGVRQEVNQDYGYRYQAKAELHFTFGALAVESHFMPAFSQADWFLGGGVVKPTARTRVRIVTKPFMARLLR